MSDVPVEKKKHMKGSWLQNRAKAGVQVWCEYCKSQGYMKKGSEFKPIPHKDTEEYKKLLTVAISVLSNSLSKVETDQSKAFLLGTIGHYHELLENYQEALQFFLKAKNKMMIPNSTQGILSHCPIFNVMLFSKLT